MTSAVYSAIFASVLSALILGIAVATFRVVVNSFRHYVEETIAPKGSENLVEAVTETRDLAARAVVIATRAEASAKRTEDKLNLLLLTKGNDGLAS